MNRIVSLRDVYPWPAGHQFVFDNGETLWTEPWPNGRHFTVHHVGDRWCPRTDDIFEWRGGQLVYVETLDWWQSVYTNANQVWADAEMDSDGDALFHHGREQTWRLAESKCVSAAIVGPISEVVTDYWRRLSEENGLLRLDATTIYNGNPDDVWAEQWFFRRDAIGWVPAATKGWHTQPGAGATPLWDMTLTTIKEITA